MAPSRTILQPTDFTANSDLAFALACSLARSRSYCVMVLHVMPARRLAHTKRRTRIEVALCRLRAETGLVAVQHCQEEGEVGPMICHVAQQCNCDLIVMGTTTRKDLSESFLDGVAKQVIRSASCPVLSVKAGTAAVARTSGPEAEAGNRRTRKPCTCSAGQHCARGLANDALRSSDGDDRFQGLIEIAIC